MPKKSKRPTYKPFQLPDECFGLKTDALAPLFVKSTFGQRIVAGFLSAEDKFKGSPCRSKYPYLANIIHEYVSHANKKPIDAITLANYLKQKAINDATIQPGVEAVTENIVALYDCVIELPFLMVEKINDLDFKIIMA